MNKPEIKTDESATLVADLPVTQDQAEETKGGDSFSVNFAKVEFEYKPAKE